MEFNSWTVVPQPYGNANLDLAVSMLEIVGTIHHFILTSGNGGFVPVVWTRSNASRSYPASRADQGSARNACAAPPMLALTLKTCARPVPTLSVLSGRR